MSQPPGESDRRRVRRRRSKSSIKICCQKGSWGMGANVARTLLDVSPEGACLVATAPLECGQEITLSLEGQWHARPVTRAARVRWCAVLADGGWCAGVHFDKTLAYHEVQDLGALRG